jgi:hypothetical protein
MVFVTTFNATVLIFRNGEFLREEEYPFDVPKPTLYPYPYTVDSFVHAIGYCQWGKEFVGWQNLEHIISNMMVCEEHRKAARSGWLDGSEGI